MRHAVAPILCAVVMHAPLGASPPSTPCEALGASDAVFVGEAGAPVYWIVPQTDTPDVRIRFSPVADFDALIARRSADSRQCHRRWWKSRRSQMASGQFLGPSEPACGRLTEPANVVFPPSPPGLQNSGEIPRIAENGGEHVRGDKSLRHWMLSPEIARHQPLRKSPS